MPSNARLNNGTEVAKFLKKIEKFYKPTASPVVDSVTGALLADATDLLPTTLASWATGDYFIVEGTGGWEFGQFGTKPGSGAIPLVRPLVFAHDADATITKATRKDLGYVENAGATTSASTSPNGLGAANARGNIAILDGEPAEPQFTFKLRESSLRTILTAYGIDEDAIRGTGVPGDPYRALVGSSNIGTQTPFGLRASGLLVRGKEIYHDMFNCTSIVAVAAAFVPKGGSTDWDVGVKYIDGLWWQQV